MAAMPELHVLVRKHVISDKPLGAAPRLMLICHNKLSMEAHARLQQSLKEVIESGKTIVIDDGFDVFQLVEGRWIAIDGKTELEDAPVPEKVNFREFL